MFWRPPASRPAAVVLSVFDMLCSFFGASLFGAVPSFVASLHRSPAASSAVCPSQLTLGEGPHDARRRSVEARHVQHPRVARVRDRELVLRRETEHARAP